VPSLVDIVTLLKCLCDVVENCVLVKLTKMSFFFLIYFLLHCCIVLPLWWIKMNILAGTKLWRWLTQPSRTGDPSIASPTPNPPYHHGKSTNTDRRSSWSRAGRAGRHRRVPRRVSALEDDGDCGRTAVELPVRSAASCVALSTFCSETRPTHTPMGVNHGGSEGRVPQNMEWATNANCPHPQILSCFKTSRTRLLAFHYNAVMQ